MEITLNVPKEGISEFQLMRTKLNTFVIENFDLIYKGARRLKLADKDDRFAIKVIHLNRTRIQQYTGLVVAGGHSAFHDDGQITEKQLLEAVKDIQILLDSAGEIIRSSFTISINKVDREQSRKLNLSHDIVCLDTFIPEGTTHLDLSFSRIEEGFIIPDGVISVNLRGVSVPSWLAIPDSVESLNLSHTVIPPEFVIPSSVINFELQGAIKPNGNQFSLFEVDPVTGSVRVHVAKKREC